MDEPHAGHQSTEISLYITEYVDYSQLNFDSYLNSLDLDGDMRKKSFQEKVMLPFILYYISPWCFSCSVLA